MTNDVINKVLYDIDQRDDTTNAEKQTARLNIGIDLDSIQDKLTAGDGISIVDNVVSADLSVKTITTTLPPVETTVNEVKVFTDGRFRCGNSDVGCLAPTPGQYDSGKVLAANWTGSPGIGSTRWVEMPNGLPTSTIADASKVLTVDSDGTAQWIAPKRLPMVRSNIAFTETASDSTTRTWTSPTIVSPSGEWAWMHYDLYVSGTSFDSTQKWDVQINGSNWTTGIYGNWSTYVCGVPASGLVFTLTTPLSVTNARISYILYQDWV